MADVAGVDYFCPFSEGKAGLLQSRSDSWFLRKIAAHSLFHKMKPHVKSRAGHKLAMILRTVKCFNILGAAQPLHWMFGGSFSGLVRISSLSASIIRFSTGEPLAVPHESRLEEWVFPSAGKVRKSCLFAVGSENTSREGNKDWRRSRGDIPVCMGGAKNLWSEANKHKANSWQTSTNESGLDLNCRPPHKVPFVPCRICRTKVSVQRFEPKNRDDCHTMGEKRKGQREWYSKPCEVTLPKNLPGSKLKHEYSTNLFLPM